VSRGRTSRTRVTKLALPPETMRPFVASSMCTPYCLSAGTRAFQLYRTAE
jgi:hypothetical protein